MAVRAPSKPDPMRDDPLAAAFHYEAAADMACSLGIAGRKVEAALLRLKHMAPDGEERQERLRDAAKAVHAYFIQRELIGLRKHDLIIREMGIPRSVLLRLGAS